jgi:hypothetical protein
MDPRRASRSTIGRGRLLSFKPYRHETFKLRREDNRLFSILLGLAQFRQLADTCFVFFGRHPLLLPRGDSILPCAGMGLFRRASFVDLLHDSLRPLNACFDELICSWAPLWTSKQVVSGAHVQARHDCGHYSDDSFPALVVKMYSFRQRSFDVLTSARLRLE